MSVAVPLLKFFRIGADFFFSLIGHSGVAEAAVVGCADDITGQAVYAFVQMKPQFDKNVSDEVLTKELSIQVRKVIGPFAAPKKIFIVSDLPKTRSGKIVRRIMRKLVSKEADSLGDLSSVERTDVVDTLKEQVYKSMGWA